jgi:hypothetical protein
VKYLTAGRVREVPLQDVVLGPHAQATLDLLDVQQAGDIPADFRMGTLELAHVGRNGSLVAEMTNLDSGGGYVLGSSFSGHPARGAGGTFWRIDGDWQTIVTLTNAARTEDDVTIELFYDGGSYRLPPIKVAAGNMTTVNVKELQRTGTPDARGGLLAATSGAFVVKGSKGTRSAISMERLIFNSLTSECVVIDGTANGYIISIELEAAGDPNPIPLRTTCYWSDGESTDETDQATYRSDNTGLVTVSGPSAWVNESAPDGSANVTASLYGPACAFGSRGFFSASLAISRAKQGFVFDHKTPDGVYAYYRACVGSCSQGFTGQITKNEYVGQYIQCNGWKIGGSCILPCEYWQTSAECL